MTERSRPAASKDSSVSSPRIRLNSTRVSQLESESDNLVDISENSRFSQWRQHKKNRKSESTEANEAIPAVSASVAKGSIKRSPQRPGFWKKLSYSIGGLLLAALLFVGIVFFSPLLATRTITVEGASLLDATTVHDQLRPLEGVPMTRITEAEVLELVGNENVLYGVTLEANPPHDLVVRLQERVPVAVVENGSTYVLVDNDGVQLGQTASVEAAGVPLVSGGLDILGSAEFQTVTGVLAALPTSILVQVAEAKADSSSTITLEMNDGTEVVWGTPADSDLKAKVLVQLMESVGAGGSVETYDVSSPLTPVTR